MTYTADILQKISTKMLNLATVTRMPDESSSLLILQGASNVLRAMIRDGSQGTIKAETAREIVDKSNDVVQTLMKVGCPLNKP